MQKSQYIRNNLRNYVVAIGTTVVLLVSFLCWYYNLGPIILGEQIVRKYISKITAIVYIHDRYVVENICNSYYIGDRESDSNQKHTWKQLSEKFPKFKVLGGNGLKTLQNGIPFVYEDPDIAYLHNFAEEIGLLNEIIHSTKNEYDKMISVFSWVGSLWDHGTDPTPCGTTDCTPEDFYYSALAGKDFWCEVTAKFTVHIATALGWPARLVTASRNGYTWEHAVAEIWSNQFNKWFLVDTDFNILYENEGIPLSSYELCHYGYKFRRNGTLKIRKFAPLKHGLDNIDLLPFYKYIHMDLRNDWITRQLRRGSPVGGDISTWWTARVKLGPIITAQTRVDDQVQYNWLVNQIQIYPITIRKISSEKYSITVGLRAYSPYFQFFEFSLDNGPWLICEKNRMTIPIVNGNHRINCRVLTLKGNIGPIYFVDYYYASNLP